MGWQAGAGRGSLSLRHTLSGLLGQCSGSRPGQSANSSLRDRGDRTLGAWGVTFWRLPRSSLIGRMRGLGDHGIASSVRRQPAAMAVPSVPHKQVPFPRLAGVAGMGQLAQFAVRGSFQGNG